MFKFLKSQSHSTIALHNSASGEIERFTPHKKNLVTMYACGPTVYDHIHFGNLRAYLLPDLLHRLFLYNGYHVKLTINFTDFGHLSDDADAGEDKIMKGMKREGYEVALEAMRDFVEPYIESFKSDNQLFGNLPATTYARASDYINEQIKLVETLQQKGYAYETSDGVYFDISKYEAYGKLGNVDISKIKAGARVDINAEKKHPADFALWKKAELGWPSLWGTGFPGWHIECTAMAFSTLGKEIDVHTGGEDLKYTHHNAELAQAESITKRPFVRYWLHNAHVNNKSEKISKSQGNGLRLSELIDQSYSPLEYRYWLLTSHYRTPVNFSFEALTGSQRAYQRLLRSITTNIPKKGSGTPPASYQKRYLQALHTDLDTPTAIATIWDMVKDKSLDPTDVRSALDELESLLGLPLSGMTQEEVAEVPLNVQTLLKERRLAREQKNWERSDTLREELIGLGYKVIDEGSTQKITKK